MRLLLTKAGCYSVSNFIPSLAIDPAIIMLVYICNLWILIASLYLYFVDPSLISSWMKDEQRGRRKKDEQREKWMRPSCLLPG